MKDLFRNYRTMVCKSKLTRAINIKPLMLRHPILQDASDQPLPQIARCVCPKLSLDRVLLCQDKD